MIQVSLTDIRTVFQWEDESQLSIVPRVKHQWLLLSSNSTFTMSSFWAQAWHDFCYPLSRWLVLRSGVIGLTTAIEIQERGKGKYRVTIVSDVFPGDPNTGVNYTSQWAVRCTPRSLFFCLIWSSIVLCSGGKSFVRSERQEKLSERRIVRYVISIFGCCPYLYDEYIALDYQKDTFKTFWEFSEEGKETEHLFQRIPQTTYHYDNHLTENSPGPDTSEAFPSVCTRVPASST